MKSTFTLIALAAIAVSLATAGAAASSQQTTATSVRFRVVEWDFLPLTATKTTVGRVTFIVRNAGNLKHEFVVVRTTKAAGALAASNAREAPEAGAVGEIEEIKPGQVKRLTLNLKAGHYTLLCNLLFHYGRGPFVDFYVR
jgi:uncharacterized cupredoxin-like copper-binding protein